MLIFCPGFNWIICFLPAEFREFTVFRIQSFDENIFINISSHSVVYFFLLLIVSFTEQTFLILMKSKFFFFFLMNCGVGVMSKVFLSRLGSWRYSLYVFPKKFVMLHFIPGCMVQFETILKFSYKVWYLGQVSIVSQGYPIVLTSFAHKTMLPL